MTAPGPVVSAPRQSDAHAERAHQALDRAAAECDWGTTAITHALLAVAAAVREHEDQAGDDAAMLAERINGVEDAIDTLTGVIDPAAHLRPRCWRRLLRWLQFRQVNP